VELSCQHAFSRNAGVFKALKALPATTCYERKLPSVYNPMIANGVVAAFGTEAGIDVPRYS